VPEWEIGFQQILGHDIGCSFFVTSFTAEGMVTIGVMVVMATDAGGPVWVNMEA
jgi:hypothetical protein